MNLQRYRREKALNLKKIVLELYKYVKNFKWTYREY